MTPLQNLYYSLGKLAYAVAKADGSIQKEERIKLQEMVSNELQKQDFSFDMSEITFYLMEKNSMDITTVYHWALNNIRLHSDYLSPRLKETFIKVMEKIAEAYAPVTIEEENLIDRFKNDIQQIHGNPLFYT